jgi:hypothetical protein
VSQEEFIMPLTNFPNGITSGGVPVHGAGFPYSSGGNHFYTDSVNGNDGNNGTSWANAKASIWGTNGAYGLLTADQHDVLHVIGGATAYAETAVCTWAKDYTHMVAETGRIFTGGRARLTNTVTTATAGEFVISAVGCVFHGIHWQHGQSATASSVVGTSITGDGRNAFSNCHFEGPIDATLAGGTAIKTLMLTSTQDNCFTECTFGARTISSSSAAGTQVHFAGENNNANVFKDCLFIAYNSTTTSASLQFVQNAMPDSGYTMLDNCTFQGCHNVAVADPIMFATGGNGTVIVKNCSLTGAGYTIWANGAWKANIDVTSPDGGATGGLGIHPT